MNLGKLCKYASECSVYQNATSEVDKPVFLIRNVFCNRGAKGWYNCERFHLYEKGLPVPDEVTPNG
ncbi:MAG TPA: hypothetical protein VFD91_01850 [Mariniphaga sp.]|nr:hypothetical protein [Mariniphaga sp.]